ncbi:MAG TPA: type 1 glutamine amidotransferase domain-containing protein [Ktedonosporobacter sp.]|nr:type 1 glutamine amidotransferase domain-containing protein [Ktedonosporobacter sp.]
MQNKKVLIAVTSHHTLGTTGRQTGYYLPEVTHPVQALLGAGFTPSQIDIVSPQGGKAPVDPSSYDLADPVNRQFIETPDLASKLEQTLSPSQVNPADYQAILFAGGHGAVWDFPQAEALLQIATTIYEQQGIVSAVCHGPAALVNLKLSDGSYLVAGKHVAAFTDDEERAVKLDSVVPFLLASTLQKRGAIHEGADLWQPKVVVDGRLVTGQNPASAWGVGEAVAHLLTNQETASR